MIKYSVKFPNTSIQNKFERVILSIPNKSVQTRIMEEVEKLADKPRPFGDKLFKQLKPPIQLYRFTAQYRVRIGDYRVLYDVDELKKTVWVLALRKRGEGTYK